MIFIIITILTNCSLISIASQNKRVDTLKYYNTEEDIVPRLFFRVLVHGNASSGRQMGVFGNFGIVKFNHAQFVIIRFFPIRLQVNNVKNVTAILYGIGQDIPTGSFDFDEEWILFAFVI
jgi:hypothetical protein